MYGSALEVLKAAVFGVREITICGSVFFTLIRPEEVRVNPPSQLKRRLESRWGPFQDTRKDGILAVDVARKP